ncbi:hypothetical protein HKO22_03180 [Peptoniphilus sp. AGMB00490]|uniref:Uncharacterized protein n=1 Tax=Peptoniphilus faecalis TaxID=2731255 RepID=A0A848R659_9FIRM|nr:hypothetical protein [Peptoniphilus faecalis]NMW84747.1 hypothetical protein [Peptoniphilus faecalis]
MSLPRYNKQAQIRSLIRTYDIRTPVEKMKEQQVLGDGSIRILPRDVTNHMIAGAKDTICIFYLEDGSLLLMEKGLAEERLKDEYGEILEQTTNKN